MTLQNNSHLLKMCGGINKINKQIKSELHSRYIKL